MSYPGPTSNLWMMDDIARRLRMLLRGGVYLRSNLAAAATTVEIGQDGSVRGSGNDIPTELFRGWTTPVLCALVQQTVAGASTLTTENVSISSIPAFAAATDGLEVTLAVGPTVQFTTALNARIRLRTHPVTGGVPPPIVQQGYEAFIFDTEKPQLTSKHLPCLTVSYTDIGEDPSFGGNVLRAESYAFTCTWIRQCNAGEEIDEQLMDDVRVLMQLVDDDNYLGGGVEYSQPLGPTFEEDKFLRLGLRERGLDVIHFGVECHRGEIRNKFG